MSVVYLDELRARQRRVMHNLTEHDKAFRCDGNAGEGHGHSVRGCDHILVFVECLENENVRARVQRNLKAPCRNTGPGGRVRLAIDDNGFDLQRCAACEGHHVADNGAGVGPSTPNVTDGIWLSRYVRRCAMKFSMNCGEASGTLFCWKLA